MRLVSSAWLVSNGGLQVQKFTEQLTWMADTFLKMGVVMRQICNHELTAAVVGGMPAIVFEGRLYGKQVSMSARNAEPMPDFVLFWDKDVRLARMMEQAGFRLFNSASAIADCDDKSATHRVLSGRGIPMPDTLVAPMNFPGRVAQQDRFVEQVERILGYPVVVKESYGSFGEQVHLAANRAELEALHAVMRDIPHLCQRFVKSSIGRDVRLQVVGTRVVAAMQRFSQTDFRANVSAGASMEAFTPPEAFVDLALRAASALGADFAGVDLLFGDEGTPLVCEVNSNAHMRNIQQCTGVDVPMAIADWILHCCSAN